MRSKYSKDSLGFTIIELLLAISLISFVIIISTNLVIIATKGQKGTIKEYEMQSDIRRATERTNEIVRYSKAIFAVPQPFVATTSAMDPGWNYFMVSGDGKRIVTMEFDEVQDKHIEKVEVAESTGILYDVRFERDTSSKQDNVLKYKIYAYTTNTSGEKANEKLLFESTVETENAIQVIDKGTSGSPSIALAFRSDGQTSGKGKNQIAYVTMIVDVSGSMNKSPDDQGNVNSEHSNARIKNVRRVLAGTEANRTDGIVQKFSKEENVFLSLVTFSTTANYPDSSANDEPNAIYPINEVYINDKKEAMVSEIDKLKAKGGTNTGDGLRRAYYLHEDFRTRMGVKDKDQVHHYMILLVDGETTYQVNNGIWKDTGSYKDTRQKVRIDGKNYDKYDWFTTWKFTSNSTNFYDKRGNINVIQNKPDDEELNFSHKEIKNIWFRKEYYAYYGKTNNPVESYSITGTGSNVIDESGYVKAMGNKIKNFESGSGIKSYLIGYADGLTNEIKYLGDSIGTENEMRFNYSDSGFNLDEIFDNIATDIMADFWLATGPQIIN